MIHTNKKFIFLKNSSILYVILNFITLNKNIDAGLKSSHLDNEKHFSVHPFQYLIESFFIKLLSVFYMINNLNYLDLEDFVQDLFDEKTL